MCRLASESPVMMATLELSGNATFRSSSAPSTSAASAALANRDPIEAATSVAVAPSAKERCEPSGSVIWMSAIGTSLYDRPFGAARSILRGASLRAADAHRRFDCERLVDVGDDGLLRGQAVGLLRGVGVAVLLPRELADLEHQLVGDLAQHEVVVDLVAIALDLDRSTDLDRRLLEELRQLGVGRLDVACADDTDGIDRAAHLQRQSCRARMPLVEVAVATARPLGEDAEQLPAAEDLFGGVERSAALVASAPVDGDHPERREEEF